MLAGFHGMSPQRYHLLIQRALSSCRGTLGLLKLAWMFWQASDGHGEPVPAGNGPRLLAYVLVADVCRR